MQLLMGRLAAGQGGFDAGQGGFATGQGGFDAQPCQGFSIFVDESLWFPESAIRPLGVYSRVPLGVLQGIS